MMTDDERVDIRIAEARRFSTKKWPGRTGPREKDGTINFDRRSRMIHRRGEVLCYHEEFYGQVIVSGHPGARTIYNGILRL